MPILQPTLTKNMTPTKGGSVALHLISESTGSLARHMVSVAMSQFPKLDHEVHAHRLCTTLETLREARNAIDQNTSPLVFSALTQPRLKRSLVQWCARRSIGHCDLLKPIIDFVTTETGRRPVRDASRAHLCDDDYFRRIDAWEFTLQHDDSRRLETIGQADLILLGISRVGKTPVAAYLGSLGYRVANVSIAREVSIPGELKQHRAKTVGLTIEPERLATIRKRRLELNRFAQALRRRSLDPNAYQSRKAAFDDVLFGEQAFRKLGLRKLDITDMTVEESAVRILNLLEIPDAS